MDKQLLIEKLKKHDRATIQYVYNTSFNGINRYVKRKARYVVDSEDVFQEALLIFYKKIKDPSFNLTTTIPLYLLGISKYIVLRALNNEKLVLINDTSIISQKSDGEYLEMLREHDQYKLFSRHFEKLGESCKKILLLFFKKTSMKDIAQEMGYASADYAKKKKLKCKKKLVKEIQSDQLFSELKNLP